MDIESVKKNATVSGECIENFQWYFLDGELYIEGTGALDYVEDWSCFYDPPLDQYWKRNKPVVIQGTARRRIMLPNPGSS